MNPGIVIRSETAGDCRGRRLGFRWPHSAGNRHLPPGIQSGWPARGERRLMRPRFLALVLALLCGGVSASDYPPEVAAYIERRELCEHFRDEPWPEGRSAEELERRDFIARQFERYCRGSDRALRELKAKYAADRGVIERLNQYEADIEARP